VDPIGSLYYDFFKTGKVGKAHTYVVEGIGEDIFPSTMHFKVLDDVVQVNDKECFVAARKLVLREGLFTGGSGGGCVSAALRVARELPTGNCVVAFLPDTGMRYLSKVFSDAWMRERGYLDSDSPLKAEDVVAAKKRMGKDREMIVAGPYQTVFHALRTMQEQDISQLPVFEENAVVGTIYEDQILNLALQGRDLRKLVIREVMSDPLPQVAHDEPVDRVTHLLSHETPAVFVVMGEGKFEILTKYDLMGTIAELMGQLR
jgi:cystathionine beta-synthase